MTGDEARTVHVTQLLQDWRAGRAEALEELVPVLYAELRRLAAAQIRSDASATIQPTELVAEAYLQLVDAGSIDWQGRAHFLSVAARVMRRVLVQRYRRRSAAKRSPLMTLATFEEDRVGAGAEARLDDLDEALNALEKLDPRAAEIVTLRFFGGLQTREIAAALGCSERTVLREWQTARRWLHRALRSG